MQWGPVVATTVKVGAAVVGAVAGRSNECPPGRAGQSATSCSSIAR